MSSSWHSARTGRAIVPSPLQQASIDKMLAAQEAFSQVTQQQQQQQTSSAGGGGGGRSLLLPPPSPRDLPSPHSPTSASAASSSSPLTAIDADWSTIPYTLTSLIQQLLQRDSDSHRNQLALKHALGEMQRASSHYLTKTEAAQLTVGTGTLQKELAGMKALVKDIKHAYDSRLERMDLMMQKQSDLINQLQSKLTYQQSITTQQLDTLTQQLSYLQRDIKERGVMMSQLGDRIMSEVEESKIGQKEVGGKMKELERRVWQWEYSTGVGVGGGQQIQHHQSQQPQQQQSNQQQPHIHKTLASHFVTHDSIQSTPPGTAIVQAVKSAATLAEKFALDQGGKSKEDENAHPLAESIAAYQREKEGQHQQQQQDGILEEKTPSPTEGATSQQQQQNSLLQALERKSSQHQQQQQQQQQLPQQQLPPGLSVFSPTPTITTASPAPVVESAPATSQFHRYQADYTTRNLQRDLLEIAETYQSTIRNEVDGLRGQLLTARRNQADEIHKLQASYEALQKMCLGKMQELSVAQVTLDTTLHKSFGETQNRVGTIEQECVRFSTIAETRASQLEQKYQQRNEEVRRWMLSVEEKVEEVKTGRVGKQSSTGVVAAASTTSSSSAATIINPQSLLSLPNTTSSSPFTTTTSSTTPQAISHLEKDLMILHINYDQTSRSQHITNSQFQSDINRLKSELSTHVHSLHLQITSVHQQMKSLFADAFAAVNNDILPVLSQNTHQPGAGTTAVGGVGASGRPLSFGSQIMEKTRFLMKPKAMTLQAASSEHEHTTAATNMSIGKKRRSSISGGVRKRGSRSPLRGERSSALDDDTTVNRSSPPLSDSIQQLNSTLPLPLSARPGSSSSGGGDDGAEEEKSPSPSSILPPPRGYGTSQQARLRHSTALQRGDQVKIQMRPLDGNLFAEMKLNEQQQQSNGSSSKTNTRPSSRSAETTAASLLSRRDQIEAMEKDNATRLLMTPSPTSSSTTTTRIDDVLKVGKRDLKERPGSSPHGREESVDGAVSARRKNGGANSPTPPSSRPRTQQDGRRSAMSASGGRQQQQKNSHEVVANVEV